MIAYNNPAYAGFSAKEIAARYAGNRLSNVRQLTAEVDALTLAPGSLDGAIFVMSLSRLYWRPQDGSWTRTDPKLMLSKLHAALKDGGVVIVQDHVANPGGDAAAIVDKLHRIDPALVRRDFEAAGFKFDGESGALKHEADDHTKLVFDPADPGQDRPVHLPLPQGCPLTADGVLRLAMWSGPRNVSTALMRSWGNRDDTVVVDEPLYAHYLAVTGRRTRAADR